VQMQTTRVPHPEALPGSALEAEADRRLRHALVTMYTSNLTGNTRANGTVAVADCQLKNSTRLTIDSRPRQFNHTLGEQPLIERRVPFCLAELRFVRRDQLATQQRGQVE